MALLFGGQTLRSPSLDIRLSVLALAGLLCVEGLIGVMLPTLGPATTMMLAAIVISPLALAAKAEHLVIATLVALFFSRLLVLGGAPSILNFAHFPLAIVSFIKLLRIPQDRSDRFLVTALLAFLAVTLFAAVVTSWQALRPFLSWVTLAEPFIFLGLIGSMDVQSKRQIRNVALAIAFLQLPIALLQFATHGVGDHVQGTLIGQGAGHHIMGAICVATGWMLLVANDRQRKLVLLVAGPLLAIGVLADAKQVYGALLVAVAILGVLQLRRSGMKVVASGAAIFGLVFLSAQFYAPLGEVLNKKVGEELLGNKSVQIQRIASEMGVSGVAFGLGPGNGLSRTALSSVPGYANVPATIIGDEPAALAADELSNYDTERVSSAASPFSSWLGIYSDIGIVGLLAYLALIVAVVRYLGRTSAAHRQASYTLLVLAALLGYIFTWLEEPGFTVFLAILLATDVPLRSRAALDAHPPMAAQSTAFD